MKKQNRILIISGNLLKHKFVGIKLLQKIKNSNIIFEKYSKNISHNYSKDRSNLMVNHFKKVEVYEKKFFEKFCIRNKSLLKKRILISVKKGQINNLKVIKKIKEYNPSLIILNATSIIKDNLIGAFKNKIINIHAGLLPYYKGAGCNVWTFFNQELEYTGVTIHFINKNIDDGRILNQSQSLFKKNDDTHSIGCKNAKLSIKLVISAIRYLLRNPSYKGKIIISKKNKIFYKKNFNKNIVKKVNELIKEGIVEKYIKNPKKIKLIKLNNL